MAEVGKQLVDIERTSVLECTPASQIWPFCGSNRLFCSIDLGERENFADLYTEMSFIEVKLAAIETIMSEYQTELGTVTAQIQEIQGALGSKEHRVRNRKDVQQHLRDFINDVNLPKNLKQCARVDRIFIRFFGLNSWRFRQCVD